MKVTLVGFTRFDVPEHVPWHPNHLQSDDARDADTYLMNTDGPDDNDLYGGSTLVEFAGRACYQSWNRPNINTANNENYIRHILRVGHLSVLEHASATFYVEGVSRSLTHELVRHRHLSFSQLSQRFVNEDRVDGYVTPPLLVDIPDDSDGVDRGLAADVLRRLDDEARTAYSDLVEMLTSRGVNRKQAREAARCVLPNMTETKIVVTGNYRAWRHFINLRATVQADAEIRELALLVLSSLSGIAPNVFSDYRIVDVPVRHAWSTLDTRDE